MSIPVNVLCIALLLSQAFSPVFASETGGTYLSRLIAEAKLLKLSDQRPWHLLLHYHKTWTGAYKSEADGTDFFLSDTGKRNPQAELEATLAAFFLAENAAEQHAQCRFPARYAWLREQLGFDPEQLRESPCERFNTWKSRLNPDSATLIFADAYLDNPPSMYGHTFLRLNQEGHRGGKRLLDYVVNYSADTATQNGIIFAAKGLFGGYAGRFSTTPFYIKVQEYTNLESRDLWEYRLNLTQEQVDRLVMHLWELGSTHFDYYFLSENCSYQLLPLLEVADASLHLTDSLKPWVIPIDTVRMLLKQPGTITHITYRPSHLKKMMQKRSHLGQEEIAASQAVSLRMDQQAEEMLAQFPETKQALILDAAYDYYRYRQGFTMDQSAENKKLERRILLRRRQLGIQPDLPPDLFRGTPPQSGHKSGRAGLSFGLTRDSTFEEISLRPALQDIAGDHTGYLPNSHLEMFHLRLRVDNEHRIPSIEKLTLIEIISISPWDSWIRELSWKAGTGLYRAKELDCAPMGCLYYGFNAGWGISTQTRLWKQEVYYLLAEIDGGFSSSFRDYYRAGGGGQAGVLLDLAGFWRLHLEGSLVDYLAGDANVRLQASLDQVFSFSKNFEARLSLSRQGSYREAVAAFNLYF